MTPREEGVLRLILLTSLLLVAGPAVADAPTRGEVSADALRVAADATVAAEAGLLDLAGARLDGLSLAWTRMEGQRVTNEYTETDLPGPVHPQPRGDRGAQAERFGPGKLTNLTCWSPCQVLLIAEGAGRIGLEGGRAQGDVAWTREASSRHAGFPDRKDPYAFYYDVGKGWLAAASTGADVLVLAGASPFAEGSLTLLLVNATGDVLAQEGTHRLDARETATAAPLGRERTARFYLLHLEGAQLTSAGPLPARLTAPAWRMTTAGDVSSERATGWVATGNERRDFEDERLLIRGDLEWAMGATSGGLLEAHALETTLSGRADLVQVGGETLRPSAIVTPTRAAGGLTLVAIVLAFLALFREGVLSFYSRLDRPKVAAHPHRQRLQESLRATPGQGPTQLARDLRLTRVVVQHHLRVLHRHGMVVQRERGPALAYFLPQDAPDPPAVMLRVAMRNGTTQKISRALAAGGEPHTQQDLSSATGVHPRLVSYHLAKLARAGLVVAHATTPQRYDVAPALRDFLGHGEALAGPQAEAGTFMP